jgi:Tfp pilus assembly protein PilZ
MPDPFHKTIVIPGPVPGKKERADPHERRSSKRFPFTAGAEVMELSSKARIRGRCSDLGLGGCFVDTLSPFAVGSKVLIRIEHGSSVLEATGAVAYAQDSMGIGLAFTEMKPEHGAVLRSWIEELSGEKVSESDHAPVQAAAAPEADAGEVTEIEIIEHVLSELIHLMVRKKTITEKEAALLLRQLSR